MRAAGDCNIERKDVGRLIYDEKWRENVAAYLENWESIIKVITFLMQSALLGWFRPASAVAKYQGNKV